MKNILGLIIIILVIISGVVFFRAGDSFSAKGRMMMRSEGGTALSEVYYKGVGGTNVRLLIK